MKIFDLIIFFTIFFFVSANNLLPTNVSNSALRLLPCNTNTYALICDPDEVFTVFERKDLKKELQKLESRTRKFKFGGAFSGDEGVTADIIITKNLINNSSENSTEKTVAEEILSNWHMYNSDQKGFVIVFSTESKKFWAIKQNNVFPTSDEFVKIFDSQKLLFEKGSYKQAFSNIITAIADKAVAEMKKRSIGRPAHDDYSSQYWSKMNFGDMYSPDKKPSKSRETNEPNNQYLYFLLFFICPVLISSGLIFAIRHYFKPSRTSTQNATEESGQCQPPPSYSEAVGLNNTNDGMPKDDKFWDGFTAASRMMGMITDNIRTGQNVPNGYIPGIQRSELPSAPIEDENNDKI